MVTAAPVPDESRQRGEGIETLGAVLRLAGQHIVHGQTHLVANHARRQHALVGQACHSGS